MLETSRRGGSLRVEVARDGQAVREAQRLRYRVFAEEQGARLEPSGTASIGLDADRFDPHCDHVVVRDDRTGRVVASTRLLTQERAMACGGFYSESEFDLGGLLRLPGRFLEVGRTCVDPGHRNGAAIGLLWNGIAPYLTELGYDHLIGCASISLAHGVARVRKLVAGLRATSPCPAEREARPRIPLPLPEVADAAAVEPCPLPPLLKAYLRLGVEICGDASWDPDFSTADLLVHLDRRALAESYARHFLKAS